MRTKASRAWRVIARTAQVSPGRGERWLRGVAGTSGPVRWAMPAAASRAMRRHRAVGPRASSKLGLAIGRSRAAAEAAAQANASRMTERRFMEKTSLWCSDVWGMGKARRPHAFWERGASPGWRGWLGRLGRSQPRAAARPSSRARIRGARVWSTSCPARGRSRAARAARAAVMARGERRRGFFMVGDLLSERVRRFRRGPAALVLFCLYDSRKGRREQWLNPVKNGMILR